MKTHFASAELVDGKLELKDEMMDIDLSEVQSNDPLAFVFGVQKGRYSARKKSENSYFEIDHDSKWTELALEYKRGFLYGYRGILIPEGTKMRKGTEQNYFFLSLDMSKPK